MRIGSILAGFRANLKNVSAKLLPTAGTVTDGHKLVYDDYAPWSVYLLYSVSHRVRQLMFFPLRPTMIPP